MIWKLDKGTQYKLVIEHSGDMYNKLDEEDRCLYFDIIFAINSIDSLADVLQCSNYEDQASGTLATALPDTIDADDLDFLMDGLYYIKYPSEFKQAKFSDGNSKNMIFTSTINLQDRFRIYADIAFDVHLADFDLVLQEMSYTEYDAESGESANGTPSFEVISHASSIQNLADNDEETYRRVMK